MCELSHLIHQSAPLSCTKRNSQHIRSGVPINHGPYLLYLCTDSRVGIYLELEKPHSRSQQPLQRHLSSCDLELWPMMNLTSELDRSFAHKLSSFKAQTHMRYRLLYRTTKRSVMILSALLELLRHMSKGREIVYKIFNRSCLVFKV